ncbi:MAG: prolipoprotein diacylglyceryl transferase [Ruminococcaceae bacterium]|nr:prolipoprotein diacylglyceryl transferase [Oscillospiraceae bacterium]
MNTLSFPGLGIGEFTVSRTAFTIFGHEIRWYGVIITLGILLACTYIAWRAKQAGISVDDVLDYAIFTVLFGILGARLYFVLMNLDTYHSLYDVLAIWNGGLAIYGGIIGGALTILIVSKHKRIDPLLMLDCVAPGVMIGQILGRWGNFFNVEAFGYETDLPWRMGIITKTGTVYVHPTFLYESLWNLLGFALINLFYKKKAYNGQILFLYIAWYGFGRMFIEGLRTDSLYIGPVRVSQALAFVSFVAAVGLLLYFGMKTKGEKEHGTDH